MSSEQTNAELLPCPFCGGAPTVTDYREIEDQTGERYGYAAVECNCLGSHGGLFFHFDTLAEAIEAWNRRPSRLEAISEAPKPDFMALAEHLAKVNNGRPVVTRESDGATFVHRDVCIEAMQSLPAQMQRERDEALLPTNARGTAYIVAKGHRMPALQIGTETLKVSGYGFPGEVRAAFTNKAGELRYVIEATGAGYAGMLHIFSPPQLVAAKPEPAHPFDPKYDNVVD